MVLEGNFTTKQVKLDGKILSPKPSLKLMNHSPDGFNWGYYGSGPAQLALAVMLEFMDGDVALLHYQKFKNEFIAKLPQDDFMVDLEMDVEIG